MLVPLVYKTMLNAVDHLHALLMLLVTILTSTKEEYFVSDVPKLNVVMLSQPVQVKTLDVVLE
jgi:hypothetical protein